MPLKWKIFRVMNFFMLLLVLAMTGTVSFHFIKDNNPTSTEILYFIAFVLGFVILIANYCSNIYLLEKYYPAEELRKNQLFIISLLLLLSCITIGLVTITYLVTFIEVVVYAVETDKIFTRPVIVASLLGMILLVSYYIFWMQVALRKTIQRNHASVYAGFLESK